MLDIVCTTLLPTFNQIYLQGSSFTMFYMMENSLEHDKLASEKPTHFELHF